MKEVKFKKFTIPLVLLLMGLLVGSTIATTLNGIYINGTDKTVKSYTNNILDWQLPLEGSYTTWAKYDLVDDSSSGVPSNAAIDIALNSVKTKLILINLGLGTAVPYNITSKTISASITFHATGLSQTNYHISSVLGTYVVVMDQSTDILKVIKDGVLQQSINVVTAGFNTHTAYSAAISWDGQWIAVLGQNTATDYYGWLLLQGS